MQFKWETGLRGNCCLNKDEERRKQHVLDRPGMFLSKRVTCQRGVLCSLVLAEQVLLAGQGHWNLESDKDFPRSHYFLMCFIFIYNPTESEK